jgi:hypothetical protein
MKSTKHVPTERVAAATEKNSVPESVATLYTQGVERMAEIQKRSIDLATQQNLEFLNIWKKNARAFPFAPGVFMIELAATTFERFADTHKGAIDLVVEQSHALGNVVKEHSVATTKANEGAVSMAQEMLEHSIETQKKVLDSYSAQARAGLEAAKHQFGIVGTPAEGVTDSIQKGLDTFVETQKELLNIASKPISIVH